MRKCLVRGCKCIPEDRGYCQKHLRLMLASGELERLHISNRGCKVEGCERKHMAHGYCNIHYLRWRRRGDPLAELQQAPDGAPAAFIEYAVRYKGKDCLTWPFGKSAKIAVGKGKSPKHVPRIICERVHGKPPTRKHEAAHLCGNGHLGCVNPMHLRWKTHAENQRDMIAHDSWRNQYRTEPRKEN